MSKKTEKEWFKDFQSFIQGGEAPPAAISAALLARIHHDLNPPYFKVFAKLAVIQLLAGAVTLIFCPQLGIGPLLGEHGLMILFMRFGPVVCAGLCGALFFGVSLLLATYLLRPQELRRMRQKHLLGIPILSGVSLMLLMILGASGTPLIYAGWLLGAILGGEVSTYAISSARLGRARLVA